ncbi:hypothetical protein ACF0H5_017238 [Mactra antiquata]
MDKYWLPVVHRWAFCFRSDTLSVKLTTANRIQSQHEVLKDILNNEHSNGVSLSTVIPSIVRKYCKVAEIEYIKANITAASSEVPRFLHSRPKTFVEHCMVRLYPFEGELDVNDFRKEDSTGSFSYSCPNTNNTYKINLNHASMPSCTCIDLKKRSLAMEAHAVIDDKIYRV